MLFDDTYKTIAAPSEGLFKDKGSKFIAYAYPVKTEEKAKGILQTLKAEHPKARHACWALRLSPDKSMFRIQDDGEPSGTAGRPILNTMLSADLTNIFIVVIRYFGGTLLGVPGLINAYKTAAAEAIKASVILEKTINDIYELHFSYLQMNEVMKLIKEEQLSILQQDFDNNSSIRFEVRKSRISTVLGKLEKMDGIEFRYVSTL